MDNVTPINGNPILRSAGSPSPSKTHRATPAEIGQLILPCYLLVAPVGADEQAKALWASAALKALEGYSVREIERGAKAAMRTADHPSKIVPAIIREIGTIADYARDTGPRQDSIVRPAAQLPAPGKEIPTANEVDEICKRFAVGRYAKAAARVPRDPGKPVEIKGGTGEPGRTPTREDYIRLGVDPATLDRLEAERAA